MKILVWIMLFLLSVCNVYQDVKLSQLKEKTNQLQIQLDSINSKTDSLTNMYLNSID